MNKKGVRADCVLWQEVCCIQLLPFLLLLLLLLLSLLLLPPC
jgi:hypothetical protein